MSKAKKPMASGAAKAAGAAGARQKSSGKAANAGKKEAPAIVKAADKPQQAAPGRISTRRSGNDADLVQFDYYKGKYAVKPPGYPTAPSSGGSPKGKTQSPPPALETPSPGVETKQKPAPGSRRLYDASGKPPSSKPQEAAPGRTSTRRSGNGEGLVEINLYVRGKLEVKAPGWPSVPTSGGSPRGAEQSPPRALETPSLPGAEPSPLAAGAPKEPASGSRRLSDASDNPPSAKRRRTAGTTPAAAASSPPSARGTAKTSPAKPSARKRLLQPAAPAPPRPCIDHLSAEEIDAARVRSLAEPTRGSAPEHLSRSRAPPDAPDLSTPARRTASAQETQSHLLRAFPRRSRRPRPAKRWPRADP